MLLSRAFLPAAKRYKDAKGLNLEGLFSFKEGVFVRNLHVFFPEKVA